MKAGVVSGFSETGLAVEDEAPALSPEAEAGIEVALESYRHGRIVDATRAREIIDAALRR